MTSKHKIDSFTMFELLFHGELVGTLIMGYDKRL